MIDAVAYVQSQNARPDCNNDLIAFDSTLGIGKADWVGEKDVTYTAPMQPAIKCLCSCDLEEKE